MTAVRATAVEAVATASRLVRGAVVGAFHGAVEGVGQELHPTPTGPALPAAGSDGAPAQTLPAAPAAEEPIPNFVVDTATETTPTQDATRAAATGDRAAQSVTGGTPGIEPPLRPATPIGVRRRSTTASRSATEGRSTTDRRTGSGTRTARRSAATRTPTGGNAGVLPGTDS